MASYIRHSKMPKEYTIIASSDWHVGSRGFHEEAAKGIINRLKKEPKTFLIFNGDAIEGKKIDSPHFAPETLAEKLVSIQDQIDYVVELLKPVAGKILSWGYGNHDIYIRKDWDCVKSLCKDLEIEHVRGGYQTWIDLAGLKIFAYHGRSTMPRGAKDPIQREANQRAWLKNRLEGLASDCHAMLMGHVHALLIQPPVRQYGLLSAGDNVRANYFEEPIGKVQTEHGECEYVPEKSRWYACTGTLRRSGGFGYMDYSEIAGYSPAPIGYVEIEVKKNTIQDMRKVVL